MCQFFFYALNDIGEKYFPAKMVSAMQAALSSKVVIIISHRLEINQAKLGGEPLHLVKLDCGTSPSLSYGYERSPKVI